MTEARSCPGSRAHRHTLKFCQIICETVPRSHLVSSTQDEGRLLAGAHTRFYGLHAAMFMRFVARTSSEMQCEARMSRFAQKLSCSGVEMVVFKTANERRMGECQWLLTVAK